MINRLTLIVAAGVFALSVPSAQAANLLNNGVLEPDPLAGWNIVNTVTGMPGAAVSSGDTIVNSISDSKFLRDSLASIPEEGTAWPVVHAFP